MFSSIWLNDICKLIRPSGDDLRIAHYRKSGKRYTKKSPWVARQEALSSIISVILYAAQEFALFTGGIYLALKLIDR